MYGQHNVGASAGDSTGQNTDKGHTLNPRIGIKIPDPPGIEPGPLVWKAGTPRPRHGNGSFSNFFFFFFFFAYLSSPNLGLTIRMTVGQMPVGGATVSGPEH